MIRSFAGRAVTILAALAVFSAACVRSNATAIVNSTYAGACRALLTSTSNGGPRPYAALAITHRRPIETSTDGLALYKKCLQLYKYDRKQPLAVVITKQKRYPECLMLRLSYMSANGERVPAIVFEPFHASRWHPVPAVILLHGLGGSKEDLVPFGHFLAATGYASLIIDEYGQGERATTDHTGSAADDIRGFQQTIIDVRRGIDYLRTRPHVSPHRIGILGFSLGAIIAADVMGIDYRVHSGVFISGGGDVGVILKHLAANAPGVHRRMAGFNWEMASMFYPAVDPLTFASHIGPRPVLMQNGTDDNIVVPECAKALYRAIQTGRKPDVQIDWIPDAGHILPLGKIYPHLRLWLDKNLKGEETDADTYIGR